MGNHVEILQDAREKYPRLLADLREAASRFTCCTTSGRPTRSPRRLAGCCAEKVHRAWHVRILYDPVGSFSMLSRRTCGRSSARASGCSRFAALAAAHAQLSEPPQDRRDRRRIGYSGGLNMTEKHLTGPEGLPAGATRTRGSPAKRCAILQDVFATMWYNTTGENCFDTRCSRRCACGPRRADPGGQRRSRLAMGGDPTVVSHDDRAGASSCVPAVAVSHSRRPASPSR